MERRSENNSTINYLLEELYLETLDFFPVNTFQPASCLFWSTILAYLISLIPDKEALDTETDVGFYLGCSILFDQISHEDKKKLQKLVTQFQATQDLTFIYRNSLFQKLIFLFRQRVVEYIEQHRNEFQDAINIDFDNYLCSMRRENKFAGGPEIKAMVALLNCSIEVIDIKTKKSYVLSPPDDSGLESKSLVKVHNLRLFFDSTKNYYYFGFRKKIKLQEKLEFIADKGISIEKKCTKEINDKNFQSLLTRIDMPRDHSCLFWAAALGYLVSMGGEQFEESCKKLFGSFQVEDLDDIKAQIISFNSRSVEIIQANETFVDLIRENFRHRIVYYMSLHRNDFEFETDDVDYYFSKMLAPDSWGGWQEVKAISAFLKCKIYLFTRWDKKLQEPLITGISEPSLYIFHDDKQYHYYLGLLKERIKDYTAKEFLNDKENQNALSQMIAKKNGKKIYTKLFNNEIKLKPNLWNDLVTGMSVGLFLELFLRLFTSMPIVKFFICDRGELSQKLNILDLIKSPSSYQEFLLSSTELDVFLDKFLIKERLLIVGILLGLVGGLIKYLINTENKDKFLLMTGIFLTTLPLDCFTEKNNKDIEKVQLIFRCLLMIFFSLQGFLNVINFSTSSVKKISNGVTYSVEKTKQVFSFFTKNPAVNEIIDSEASLQYGTGVSR